MNTPSRKDRTSLGRQVLARALRDPQRLLRKLVVGDVIGERRRVRPALMKSSKPPAEE